MPKAFDTYLSFDFGLKRIGVAVGQVITRSATPLPIVFAQEGVPNWDTIDALMKEWRPKAIVIGMPLNMDGTKQDISYAAEHFASQLQERYHLPVHLVDERLTTKEARARVFEQGGYKALKKQAIDSHAAKLILESWLANQ